MGEKARVPLESLGGPGDAAGLAQKRFQELERAAKRMRWHSDQRVARRAQRAVQIQCDFQRRRKHGIGQIPFIAARAPHRVELREVAAPQEGAVAGACQLDGQRRSPRAGANNQHA